MANLFILAFEALVLCCWFLFFPSITPLLTPLIFFLRHNFHHIESVLFCVTHFPGEYLAFFTGIPVCLGVLEMGQRSYRKVAPYF